jgi:RNA polymerase-binding transcription factor DksA
MADVADAAEQTIELELQAQLSAIRRHTGPVLEAIRMCHNCSESLPQGQLFCSPLVDFGLSECQVDYENRAKRTRR